MEQEKLITALKELKNISPRKEWVGLAKVQLFQTPKVMVPQKAMFTGWFAPRRLAYSFAALLVVVVGVYGALNFSMPSGNLSTASLADAENTVAIFKVKSQNLSQAPKNKTQDVSAALKEVKVAAKNVTDAIKSNPQLASKVALEVNNNKTYLDVAGANTSSEVSDMYEAIVTPLIADLDNRTLTKEEQVEFDRIKTSLKKTKDYTTALRDILLISRAGESK